MMRRFLILLGLLASAPALAAPPVILAACTEDISDCIFQSTVTVDATAGHFTAGRARFGLIASPNSAIPPSGRIETKTFTPSSDFWVSANYYSPAGGANNYGQYVSIGFVDNGVNRLLLRVTGTGGGISRSVQVTLNLT